GGHDPVPLRPPHTVEVFPHEVRRAAAAIDPSRRSPRRPPAAVPIPRAKPTPLPPAVGRARGTQRIARREVLPLARPAALRRRVLPGPAGLPRECRMPARWRVANPPPLGADIVRETAGGLRSGRTEYRFARCAAQSRHIPALRRTSKILRKSRLPRAVR